MNRTSTALTPCMVRLRQWCDATYQLFSKRADGRRRLLLQTNDHGSPLSRGPPPAEHGTAPSYPSDEARAPSVALGCVKVTRRPPQSSGACVTPSMTTASVVLRRRVTQP